MACSFKPLIMQMIPFTTYKATEVMSKQRQNKMKGGFQFQIVTGTTESYSSTGAPMWQGRLYFSFPLIYLVLYWASFLVFCFNCNERLDYFRQLPLLQCGASGKARQSWVLHLCSGKKDWISAQAAWQTHHEDGWADHYILQIVFVAPVCMTKNMHSCTLRPWRVYLERLWPPCR